METLLNGSWYAVMATLAFFTIKGLAWLAVPVLLVRLRARRQRS